MDTYFECYVSGVFAAIFRLARFAGLAPLHFVKKKTGWMITVSVGWSLYGYIMITIICCLAFVSLTIQLRSEPLIAFVGWSKTRCAVWTAQDSLMMLTSAMAVFKAPSHMRLLIALMNRVRKINVDLNINDWPRSSGTKFTVAIIMQLVLAVIVAFIEIPTKMINYWSHNISIEACISGSNVFYFMCYWILEIRNVQFIVSVLHVRYSFIKVNYHLKNLLHEHEQSNFDVFKKALMQNNFVDQCLDNTDAGVHTSKSKIHQGSVRRLMQLYASLCRVVRDMDQVNGSMVLLFLVSYMLQLICTAYHIVIYLTTNPNQAETFITLIWFFIHMFCLVMTIEPCHSTHMEMTQTRELVSHLIGRLHSILYDPLDTELEQFFRHLVLNEVYYMPLDVTTMSRTLLLTILGSVTTYTVVILHM